MSPETEDKRFAQEKEEILKSINPVRIIAPILLGLGVVGFLFYRAYLRNSDEIKNIAWDKHVLFWVIMAFVLLIIRHLAYANRLRVLSDNDFSWRKCIELIFIWEFSSAVSPTSVGGSAVALVVLAQEKLTTARTTTIVLYSAILDTIFFVGTLPILLFFLGPEIIRPELTTLTSLDGWGITFLGAYILMLAYGSLFFYGLFINPKITRRLLRWVTGGKGWLSRFRPVADQLGRDFIVSSREIWRKKFAFHAEAFLSTATAWSCRFLLLNFLIIAFVPAISTEFWTQFALYARLETMFVIIAFSPTPGAAGFAEIVFYGFLNDYVSAESVALVIAVIWRFLTYYLYLFMGAIIIPNWLQGIIKLRQQKRLEREASGE
ncbi:MAG: flippase-like domain-containing protein [Saprospiraceae bacterium]|nr:flippase-like domain-containing protein [Saprospiraceae bacterium]